MTKAVDITAVMSKFFYFSGLLWDLVEAIYTDGTWAMLEKNSGFMSLIKVINPDVILVIALFIDMLCH
jgi:hypothetical protein